MRILKVTDFSRVRQIIFVGEGFPKSKLKKLAELFSSRIRFTNVYGPTECTCICSSYDLQEKDLNDLNGILPLGRINPNFDFIILDAAGQQVVRGDVGELCLLGPCVGKGYYGNMLLTEKSFKQNPFSPHVQELMYCTGDLVFQDVHTHELHFVARKDNQIKHQGYRIELDEIEAALNSLSYIDEAVVIYSQHEALPGKITGVVVTNTAKSEAEITQDLRKRLPEYMVPRALHFKERLPKNQNGKIDRAFLVNEYHVI